MTKQIKKGYSNFITPPDVIDPKENSVVITIIDANWPDVEALAVWAQSSPVTFDVYLYHHLNNDLSWLDRVVGLSNAVLINTDVNEFSLYKDLMIELKKAWHYGEKTFLGNTRHVKNPVEFFEEIATKIEQIESQKV